MPATPSIAVFSDVICPWCFLGKRRLERALAEVGISAPIRWLPFELNPAMPPEGMERALYRARKFGPDKAGRLDREMTARGLEEGIRFTFGHIERTPNTRKAHMLIAHASSLGFGDAAAEALFRAYFERALDIGRTEVLADLAREIGLDPDAALAALDDPALLAAVVAAEDEAARLDVSGVPFFILDGTRAIAGAQPATVWVDLLRQGANLGSQVPAG
ncbi:MAG TPA: DsbA family oxidoreductase [Beijerinckiaceae bacterium]|nr:DsbA family oxidoreductase [Beijerinckiaceae bacterium]